jgi:hypothetical protein
MQPLWSCGLGLPRFPSNVLGVRDVAALRKLSIEFFPQGWNLFTNPPSDSEPVVYSFVDDRVVDANKPPQARAAE